MTEISGEFDVNLNSDVLSTSTGNLAKFNQILSNDVNSIKYISKQIENNWTNDTAGSDIFTSLNKIRNCEDKIENVVFPILNQYVETMNALASSVNAVANNTTGEINS